MHLHTTNGDVPQIGRPGVNFLDSIKRNSELIFAPPGRNVAMSSGLYIGINPHSDRGAHTFLAGDSINAGKLGFAFDIETEDFLIERICDFLWRFSDASECAPKRVSTGGE